MNRTLLLCTVLLAGCDRLFGVVEDRQACAASVECPTGQFCADAGSARICWPDAVAPAVAAITVTCSTAPCRRDAALTVEASVTDDAEVGPVTVELDLDGGARRVEMTRVAGALHRAALDVADWPLPGLSGAATATVRAEDGAGNGASATAPPGQRPVVTRLAGAVALGVTPTAPALQPDGTVVVGGSDGRLRFLAPGATSATTSTAAFGPSVAQPPTVGSGAIWVASTSNRLFASSLDGSTILNGAGYDTGGAIPGPAAITATSTPEVAFVGSAGGRMAAVKADATANGLLDFVGGIGPFSSGPVLVSDAALFAVTSTTAPQATLREFTYADGIREGTSRNVGLLLTAPIAVGSGGDVWTGSSDLTTSTLQQTVAAGGAGTSVDLLNSVGGSPIVLSNGDVAVCVGAELRRYTAAGALAWAAPLDGAGLSPIALAGPGGEATLLVPTRAGQVLALDAASGARRWTASLTVNVELREGTVRTAAGARTSTAWFTSADGLLHGLVVDGALDPAAPWPKAWHDERNTGNLTTPR